MEISLAASFASRPPIPQLDSASRPTELSCALPCTPGEALRPLENCIVDMGSNGQTFLFVFTKI